MPNATSQKEPKPISRALVRLMMAVDDAYTQASREVGLTPQQAQLLCAAQRPAPLRDIAAFLHSDRSNISHLVDRATSRGLLQRRAAGTDGRVKLVELSADGERVVERFIQTLGSRFEPVVAEWPEARQKEAVATLHALADAIHRAADADADTRSAPAGTPFP